MKNFRIRKSGPPGVSRPFTPTPDINGSIETGEKIAEALEHIAVALSAIDHNLEVLTNKVGAIAHVLPQLKR